MKLRCRKGVPSSLRAKAWQLLSNSQELLEANPGKFEVRRRAADVKPLSRAGNPGCPGPDNVSTPEGGPRHHWPRVYHALWALMPVFLFAWVQELEREPGEAKWLDIIEKDLHRQFPFHEMFAARGGHG